MITKVVTKAARQPVTIIIGLLVGFIAAMVFPATKDLMQDSYNSWRPVVRDWKVDAEATVGGDVVLTGTMIKQRDCVYLPPTLARDQNGQNYIVESTSPTAGKTWDADEAPQRWGPWTVRGAADKRLTFVIVYLCNGSNPTIVKLGTWARK
jgi:hypothetical protein